MYQQVRRTLDHLRLADQVRERCEQLKRERMERTDRINKMLAEAGARMRAEEQERLNKVEQEYAHYKVGSPYELKCHCYIVNQMQMLPR